jgi:hypothetical protein
MSGNLSQQIPRYVVPIIDPATGIATQEFWRFLLTLLNRTGGSPGSNSALTEALGITAGDDDALPADQTLALLSGFDDGDDAPGAVFPDMGDASDVVDLSAFIAAEMTADGEGADTAQGAAFALAMGDDVAGAEVDPLLAALMTDGPDVPQTPKQMAVTVGASPYAYSAPERGAVLVTGGVVSAVTYSRDGATTYAMPVSGSFPVGTGDIVTVTYTVAPTMAFVQI